MGISPSYTAIINSCQMLFYTGKRVTIVSNQKVQRQQGASDCGLFAIHSTSGEFISQQLGAATVCWIC